MATLTVRSSTSHDLLALRAPMTEAFLAEFGESAEADLVETLHDDGDSLVSLVAERGGQLLGHIQAFPIEVNGPPGAPVAGLGPMFVRGDQQRAGIGTELVRALLRQLTAIGVAKVFVLGHPDYYRRFGFSADATAGYAAPWGGPAFLALDLAAGAPAFGELVYPAAFLEG